MNHSLTGWNNALTGKLAAFCIALSLNVGLFGGIAYLFDGSAGSERTHLVATSTAGAAEARGSFC